MNITITFNKNSFTERNAESIVMGNGDIFSKQYRFIMKNLPHPCESCTLLEIYKYLLAVEEQAEQKEKGIEQHIDMPHSPARYEAALNHVLLQFRSNFVDGDIIDLDEIAAEIGLTIVDITEKINVEFNYEDDTGLHSKTVELIENGVESSLPSFSELFETDCLACIATNISSVLFVDDGSIDEDFTFMLAHGIAAIAKIRNPNVLSGDVVVININALIEELECSD